MLMFSFSGHDYLFSVRTTSRGWNASIRYFINSGLITIIIIIRRRIGFLARLVLTKQYDMKKKKKKITPMSNYDEKAGYIVRISLYIYTCKRNDKSKNDIEKIIYSFQIFNINLNLKRV